MQLIVEGKTKRLWSPAGQESGRIEVESLDLLTAKDGAVRASFSDKGVLANATTCNVFKFLKRRGVPLAFRCQYGDRFITEFAHMIPVEVVARNKAAGSYCVRNPSVEEGSVFIEPVVEFYYKTTGGMFFGRNLGIDDPLMVFSDDGSQLMLHDPGKPIIHDQPLLEVDCQFMTISERVQLRTQLAECRRLAQLVNQHLSWAWSRVDGDLIDFKIECGVVNGQIVVADVLDCDSWRVIWNGQQLSKQPFRDGVNLAMVRSIYLLAEAVTRRFADL